MPDMKLYGYNIYGNLEYRLNSKTIINIKTGRVQRIGETNSRLLSYLLENARKDYICDNDIIIDVFDSYDLRCSKSRLWSAIKAIKDIFLMLGFDRKFINRYQRKGYSLQYTSIEELYSIDYSILNKENEEFHFSRCSIG